MNKKIDTLIKLCQLSRNCFNDSKILSRNEIESWIILIDYSQLLLLKTEDGNKLNSYQIASIEKELLNYWNNHLNIEVEMFWKKVKSEALQIKRNATFESIIEKKRFKSVEQAIDVYNDFYNRPNHHSENQDLNSKFERLYEIIQLDRNKRLMQFRKWIKNKKVSISDKNKFGENYAYLKRTNQFEDIFDMKDQIIIKDLIKNK